uniref:ANK_REP_REGION domain-containing protein n=1 Tax=Globodera pallida TaxID=36090 RepID=A0A183CEI8_GLOPA
MCRDLVAKGAAVNEESNNGFSPWLEACEKGHLGIIEFFVEIGQNIEEADSNGYTALIITSTFGRTNVGHFLLSKGACVSWTNAFGLPALFFAAKEGHLEMCKELVAKGADANQKSDNSSPWLEACKKGHLNIVEFFANNGQYIEATDSDGDTGLIAASFNGNADVVREFVGKVLVARGADVNQESGDDSSPWLIACEKGHLDIVEFFVAEGQDIKFTHSDVLGLFFAAKNGHLEVCKVLVARGADVNRESENSSPWLIACEKSHLDIVKLFVANGQDIEVTNMYGATGLIVACIEGNANLVRAFKQKMPFRDLVANGADVNRESENGFSPWLEACAKGHLDIVKLFVANGQDIEVTNMYGATGLIVACIEGNANLVRAFKQKMPFRDLVANGADVNRESENGFSPWLEACAKGHLDIGQFQHFKDIEFTYSDGATGLVFASREERTNVARFLLSIGARIGRTDAKK